MSTLKFLENRHLAALGRLWPRQGPGAHQPARACLVPFLKGDVKSKGKGEDPTVFDGEIHLFYWLITFDSIKIYLLLEAVHTAEPQRTRL